jgi:hypothetical protein
MTHLVFRMLLYLWAGPNSALGMLVGCLALVSGGGMQIRRSCVEFYGGWLEKLLDRLPPQRVQAMTLGHTILGTNRAALEACRDHEQVHVRQYERWGAFFIPAYLGFSLYLWLRGRDYYLENPFEIEAYANEEELS